MNSKRLANIELLRIIAMLGVIIGHYFNYGLHIYEEDDCAPFTVNVESLLGKIEWGVLELVKLITLVSVNCYILITVYFMASQTKLRIKGIWKVWSTTWIYSVCIYTLFLLTDNATFSTDALLENIAPVYSNTYWFVTSYIFLMLLSPLLSYIAINLTHRQYIALLVAGFVLCFQMLLGQFVMSDQQLPLFAYLYFIGGYIKKISAIIFFQTIVLCLHGYAIHAICIYHLQEPSIAVTAFHDICHVQSWSCTAILRFGIPVFQANARSAKLSPSHQCRSTTFLRSLHHTYST